MLWCLDYALGLLWFCIQKLPSNLQADWCRYTEDNISQLPNNDPSIKVDLFYSEENN